MGHLSDFFDTRAEIKPKGAGTSIYGWVSNGSEGVLVIESSKPTGLTYGQPVEVILSAHHVSTRFIGVFVGEENGSAIFSVPISFPLLPGCPSARVRGKFETAVCVYRGTRLLVPVIDASETGLCVQAPHHMEKGSEVQIELEAEGCKIPIQAIVQYSQSESGEEGEDTYRVGMGILHMMRTDMVRWRKSISQRAA